MRMRPRLHGTPELQVGGHRNADVVHVGRDMQVGVAWRLMARLRVPPLPQAPQGPLALLFDESASRSVS